MSMHVGSEPGLGSLIFKRTGEVLWTSKIVRRSVKHAFTGKDLTIYFDDRMQRLLTVDGTNHPISIFQAGVEKAHLQDVARPDANSPSLQRVWLSVKVMIKTGWRPHGASPGSPVIFPDDPPCQSSLA